MMIITLFEAPIEVIGEVCHSDTSVGIMSDYFEIHDLRIGGVSVYVLLDHANLVPQIEELANSKLFETEEHHG
jgi:hypothetical protein